MTGHVSCKRADLDEIAAFVEEQPRASADIAERFNLRGGSLGRVIGELKDSRRIVQIGNALQARRMDLFSQTPIYAKPGTPKLPKYIPPKRDQSSIRKPKNKAGSGVIAGRPYAAPVYAGPSAHMREAFERMRIALAGPR